MTTTNGARYLASALDRYGVTHVFLVPTIISHTLVAMEENTGIARVVTHGEKAAAYMADGYARAAGRIGVCAAQVVGSANLAAGLQDAYLGCSPVVALTGSRFPHGHDRHFYQEIDAKPMFAPVTKWSARVSSVERLPDVVQQAVRTATTGCPGPVHVEIDGHAGERVELGEADLDDHLDPRFGMVPPFRPAPEAGAVEMALAAIAGARRPVIVAGGGVRTSGAQAQLRAFAEALQIPVATSLNAKDVIPAGHPLAVGVVGLYCRKSANRVVGAADLVVYVGSRTGSQVTFNWQVPSTATPVVHVDIEPSEMGRHYPRTTPVVADARVALEAMLTRVAGATVDRSDWLADTQRMADEFHEEFDPLLGSDAVPMRPERLCSELTAHLPSDAMLVADTGHAGMWAGGMIDLRSDDQQFLRAAGSLGWGLPAAIGAQLARPELPVVLFTGDGGLWYHLSELETAVRWGVNLVVVVNDNRSLNQEINPFLKAYGGSLRGRHHELWHFEEVDFARVAEDFGATGLRVTEPSHLPDALDKAFSVPGPVVVDVVTNMEVLAPLAYLPPPEPVA